MLKALQGENFLRHLVMFILFNLLFYAFLNFGHSLVPFDRASYYQNAHHYINDPRIEGLPFSFLTSIAQYDAQWYLKIADTGYSYDKNTGNSLADKSLMSGLSYNFFPFFPLVIRSFSFVIGNLELAAFIASNLLFLFAFVSLYLFTSHFYTQKVAGKTVWLLFLFPFSVFYRTYYTESLFLALSVWFLYFLIKRKFVYSAVFLALLNVTKGRAFPLDLILLAYLALEFKRCKISFISILTTLTITVLPLSLWALFNFHTTGNPFYFKDIVSAWMPHPTWISVFLNLRTVLNFTFLPFHAFHYSQVEIVVCFITAYLLYKSRKFLKTELWLFSLITWAFPLFVVDFTSFSRYQAVSFPLFIYLSSRLSNRKYTALILFFLLLFLPISILFVNWYWIG